MGLRSINCSTEQQCAPPFCRCFSAKCGQSCRCGESDTPRLDWTWDTDTIHPEARIDGESVVFHPISSRGTAVVRGDRPLELNHIHYWEVKITSVMSGTDFVSNYEESFEDNEMHYYQSLLN